MYLITHCNIINYKIHPYSFIPKYVLTYIKYYIKIMSMKKQFSLTYRKTRHGKKIYYMYFYRQDIRKCISTGKGKKYEAEIFAKHYLENLTGNPKKNLCFGDYAANFFDWDCSPWIKRQQAKKRPFSRAMAAIRRGHLANYLLPAFGNKLLTDLNAVAIENWLACLPRANQTRKHILGTLRIILGEADREALIPFNPALKVEPFGNDSKKRDIFTREELGKLFPSGFEGLVYLWGNIENAAMFLLLATTGMRSGELRALQWRHFHGEGYLEIAQAVKSDGTIGPTKTHKERTALLISRNVEILKKWACITRRNAPEDFIFPSDDGRHPAGRLHLPRAFREALTKAEIATDGRNIVVHSFRHTFNTLLKPLLPLSVLQSLTGHSSQQMSEHYNHPSAGEIFNALKSSLPVLEDALNPETGRK
jgi:integrase